MAVRTLYGAVKCAAGGNIGDVILPNIRGSVPTATGNAQPPLAEATTSIILHPRVLVTRSPCTFLRYRACEVLLSGGGVNLGYRADGRGLWSHAVRGRACSLQGRVKALRRASIAYAAHRPAASQASCMCFERFP